ncbi:chondroitin proteoglycan 1 [Plakobranchus ocellatus]|uniref:Chondroitin proteoglycan 1 n=1 Tax=Plakobranchus ocellatus TaxID=259542 RepID=A0AAV4DKA0_9GAST|nr:chondroitin proteoglycan 1 [Plakobranchus ocellatus]
MWSKSMTCAAAILTWLFIGSALGGSHDVLSLCRDNDMADGIYSHPSDCTMFIECSGRITSEFDCPANLVFNPDLRVCDDPHSVIGGLNCVLTTTTSTTAMPTSSSTPPTTVTTETSTTMPTMTTTPPTTTTTMPTTPPTTTTTTTTTTATSTTTSTTTPTTTTSTTASTTPPPTVTTFMKETTTTSKVTASKIELGIIVWSVILSTPSSLANPALNVDITNLCVDKSLSNGIHPDPTSCVHFIECSFGQTYRVPCPSGLAYNTRAQTCDDKFNVDCDENYNSIVG